MAESKRASSAGYEVFRLRETVARLNRELIALRAAVHFGQEQLGCLTGLVKRAWTGDAAAAVHVANIVGVAPPRLTVGDSADGRKIVMAHIKHISPWKATGSEKEDNNSTRESTKRLIQRTAYLDEQMQEHTRLRSPSLGVPRHGSTARPHRPLSQAAATTATAAATTIPAFATDSASSSDKSAQEPHTSPASHALSAPSQMDSPAPAPANKFLGKRSNMVSEQDMSDINSLLTTAMLAGDKDPDDKLAEQTALCGWTPREPPNTAFKLFHQTLGGTSGDVARQPRPGTAVVGRATVGEARPFSAATGMKKNKTNNSPRFGRLFLTGGVSRPAADFRGAYERESGGGGGAQQAGQIRPPHPEPWRTLEGTARHKPVSGRAKLSARIFAEEPRRRVGEVAPADGSGRTPGAAEEEETTQQQQQQRRAATLLQRRLGIADSGLV
uniref:Uncharacterized protein LOC116952070 isoform X1 n=1 Tax=Petromyzon marinus TaxID=7757 RepID=A0AAJ7TZJ9_PETMA|nr:uncharacterized protein LOC116952070 isoform X1 [Petromyzon marinus]